jgi:hypothetical protein
MAPATAPTGPSTSAPDKAPSAASPVRSWAIAAEDISAKEIVTIAIVFFIQDPRIDAKACEFGLEGLISKHRDQPYRAGRQKHWLKVKNR